MEAVGALAMYQRSIEKHRLIYSEYLGDGDTSFKEIVDADPYKKYHTQVIKLECCGHVQKRLKTQLRNKVKEFKGTQTPLSLERASLQQKINSMQNFYGLAIRQNTGNLYSMKKAVGAILYHYTKFNDETSKDENTAIAFVHPVAPADANTKSLLLQGRKQQIMSIRSMCLNLFMTLLNRYSVDCHLMICSVSVYMVKTQNGNESLNNLIWTKCPKNTFVERPIIEMGVNSAVIDYEGSTGIFSILRMFHISQGSCSIILSEKRNSESEKYAYLWDCAGVILLWYLHVWR